MSIEVCTGVMNLFEFGDERYRALLEGKFSKGLGIQVFRRLLGVTQEELASKLGVTMSAVSSWENGRSSCSPERIEQIAQVLGVLPARLLNPALADVEKASHTSLYAGHKLNRMVLSVPQADISSNGVKGETKGYVASNAIVNIAGKAYKVAHLDRLPTPGERKQSICWVYGPSDVVRSVPGHNYSIFIREPSKVEVVQLSFGGWVRLGEAIRSYMRLRHMSNENLARRLECSTQFVGELLNSSGLDAAWVNTHWGTLDLMTDIMRVDAGTFHIFTQRGREFVLSKVLEGIV